MKTLKICGWAVILAVTILLVACASQSPKVTGTSMMSGSDATMTQPDSRMFGEEDRSIIISQDWLDERERAVEQRELDLARRENALAINQAWLNEREMRLAMGVTDLTKPEDVMAFKDVWSGEQRGLPEAREEVTQSTEPQAPVRTAGEGRCFASVLIPAQYRTVAVTKPIELPKGENLPLLYQTVTEQVKISDEYMSNEEILCAADMTPCRVVEIQRSLQRGGYNPGPIDGIVGQKTMAAINAFQKDFNLTVANELTIETVEALNIHF